MPIGMSDGTQYNEDFELALQKHLPEKWAEFRKSENVEDRTATPGRVMRKVKPATYNMNDNLETINSQTPIGAELGTNQLDQQYVANWNDSRQMKREDDYLAGLIKRLPKDDVIRKKLEEMEKTAGISTPED